MELNIRIKIHIYMTKFLLILIKISYTNSEKIKKPKENINTQSTHDFLHFILINSWRRIMYS